MHATFMTLRVATILLMGRDSRFDSHTPLTLLRIEEDGPNPRNPEVKLISTTRTTPEKT